MPTLISRTYLLSREKAAALDPLLESIPGVFHFGEFPHENAFLKSNFIALSFATPSTH
jgi:hypothetical protein